MNTSHWQFRCDNCTKLASSDLGTIVMVKMQTRGGGGRYIASLQLLFLSIDFLLDEKLESSTLVILCTSFMKHVWYCHPNFTVL